MDNLLKSLDLFARAVALLGVIPFGLFGLLMSVFATDSGTALSKLSGLVMFALVGGLCWLIVFSVFAKEEWLNKQTKLKKLLVKLPAYIFCPIAIIGLWSAWLKNMF